MRFVSRIALTLIVAAPLFAIDMIGAQTRKVIDLKAPVINDKELKVECVHSRPHMVLRSKIKETARISITTRARVVHRVGSCGDPKLVDPDHRGNVVLSPGEKCTLFFSEEDAGSTSVTQVSASTDTASYAFRGDWPIYVCCRGGQEFASVTDPKVKKREITYRGYEITFYPDRVDSHNREKDSNDPIFSNDYYWKKRSAQKGRCESTPAN